MGPKRTIGLVLASAFALGVGAAQAQSSSGSTGGSGGTSAGTSAGTSMGTSTGTSSLPGANTPGVINPATGLPNPPIGTTGSSGRLNPRITNTPNNSITSSPGTQVIQPYTSPSGHGSLSNQGTGSGTIGGVPQINSTVRP